MDVKDFSKISVDELFENYTVEQIEQIQKKIQDEAEKKREELRTMVGERYRDLLKAADTIAKMKNTSASVVIQNEEITTHCKILNEKRLIGFKTDSYESQIQNKQLNQYFGTVLQIKLLTSLPEMIWSHIDNNRYFIATQLYIFSQHISTGLQLDLDNKFTKYFPVAQKQWEILKPFYLTLKQVTTAALEKESISKELACDCLLAIFLLERNSLEEILNTFLHLRTKAYLSTICGSDKGTKRRVRDRILNSLQVLISTIDLIAECFLGQSLNSKVNSNFEQEPNGLIFHELEKLNDLSAKPTIFLMNLDDTDLICVLPDIILKFKPSFEAPVLSVKVIKEKIENWYLSISNVANNQLRNLFDLISSMKTLQEVQKRSIEIEESSCNNKFSGVISTLTISTFYQNLYKPLLNLRIREIIRQSWIDCVKLTYNEINDVLKRKKEFSVDEESLLWTDQNEDLPLSLKIALNQDKKQNKLLMKIKGYNEDIINVCSSFDERLETILNDLSSFLSNENIHRFEEKQSLEDFMRIISKENSIKLIELIKENNGNEQQLTSFIVLARILTALIELCSKFKVCLSYKHTSITNWDKLSLTSKQDKNASEFWHQICKIYEEESFVFWKKFCDKILEQYPIKKWMADSLEHQLILRDFLNWDSISIDDRDEQGDHVESIIKIPSQIRISLQTYFFDLITSLNKFVPQTLPKKVLHYLNTVLLKNLLEYYTYLLEERFLSPNQNIALQIYFDLKFLQLLFITRDDKKDQEIIQKLVNILKGYIDPFDFELFHLHLNNNVQNCAIRMQHLLGIILPHPEILEATSNNAKQYIAVQDKDPNILCISCSGSSSTWFPLLPIAVSSTDKSNIVSITETEKVLSNNKQIKKTEILTKQQPTSSQTAQTYASNVKSGAAAFFGAMSQDWFR